MNITTDKIIAVGLMIIGIIYSSSSIILGIPVSETLLGTLFGGILGALGRFSRKNMQEESMKDKEDGKDELQS